MPALLYQQQASQGFIQRMIPPLVMPPSSAPFAATEKQAFFPKNPYFCIPLKKRAKKYPLK
jgi:hypothetical protein